MIDIQPLQNSFTSSRETYGSPFERLVRMGTHDVRECLRMITTYAGLLKREAGQELNEEHQGYLDYVLDGSARLVQLSEALAKFARAAAIPLTHTDVSLEIAVEGLQKSMGANGRPIEWEIGELPTVWADNELMHDLLERLVSNCVKFTPPDRKLKISVSGEQTASGTVVRIGDNGMGIAPEFLAHLFEPFRRIHSKKEFPGVGLGLAYCREIVELHGGSIRAESALDRGTTIEISFPKKA